MSSRGKVPVSKDLCMYIVEMEAVEDNGISDEVIRLVRQSVQDKIFSDNQDHVCVVRSDQMSSFVFGPPDWKVLRNAENVFRETVEASVNENPISCLLMACECMGSQALEDSYENKMMMFFGNLRSHRITKDEVKTLLKKLGSENINLCMTLPDKKDCDGEVQEENVKLLTNAFKNSNNGIVSTYPEVRVQLANTITKKVPRPSPWNVCMEIGPDIKINVGGYICIRKNKAAEISKVYVKDSKNSAAIELYSAAPQLPQQSQSENALVAVNNGASSTSVSKTTVTEAKSCIQTEQTWKEKDGSVVDEEDIGKGYYYGDRLIPYNDLESENSYDSGEKCLKVLLFCPKDNIQPGYLMGDGTTLFAPKTGDVESELKFAALLEAMNKSDRVAIVRKVYRKGTKALIGILSPDMERKCLVFIELCYADDVSIPHFVPLVKPTGSEDEGINEKEALIDEFICARTIENFSPISGPVDPAVQLIRENISRKILGEPPVSRSLVTVNQAMAAIKSEDNIELYFEKIMLKDDLREKLMEAFPLKINAVAGDRPSGVNVFRKRQRADNDTSEDKKIKMEEASHPDEPIDDGVTALENEEMDADDLLDEL